MASASQTKGLSPLWAASLAVGAVTAALLVGKRASPSPDHPRTRRWYRRLDKPGYTPPSLVYPDCLDRHSGGAGVWRLPPDA